MMTAGSEVEIGQLVSAEALVPANVGEIEDGEGEARKGTDVYFVGGKPCSGVDGVVVCALHVWQLLVPLGLLFVDHHGDHQGHYVIDALDTTVGEGVGRRWW